MCNFFVGSMNTSVCTSVGIVKIPSGCHCWLAPCYWLVIAGSLTPFYVFLLPHVGVFLLQGEKGKWTVRENGKDKGWASAQEKKEACDLAHFKATCPKTKKGSIPCPILPRKAKMPKLPSAYEVYVSLVDILKMHSEDFKKQQSILEESGTVFWRENCTLGFKGNILVNPPGGAPRMHKHYDLQIWPNATFVWEDLLEIKTSSQENAGLGLFACRPFKWGKIISLYAGVEFDPKHPPVAKYHMQSKYVFWM
jgi:hypothetical protein